MMAKQYAYYNEIDPFAAQWLHNLIAAGHIAPGDVDERSIEDVRPDDLRGYTQCHFFAGIGVWSYALRQAGFPDDRPAWTGSCPCQPFSTAGRRAGFADERHLWPVWFSLISECRPPVIFGEQVASTDGYAWLDVVWSDLEAAGYAFAPVVLPAAGFGAPHGRHRIYFVADADRERLERRLGMRECSAQRFTWESGVAGIMGDTGSERCDIEHTPLLSQEAGRDAGSILKVLWTGKTGAAGPTNGFWRNADWLFCRDGKWRPVESGSFPLAHGITSRMGRLRAYGNAIVAPLAKEFITAYMELMP